MSIATVAQVTRNANEITISSFNNSAERRMGGQRKMKELGARVQQRPQNRFPFPPVR